MKKTFMLLLSRENSHYPIELLTEPYWDETLTLLRSLWPPDRTFSCDLFERMESTWIALDSTVGDVVGTASAGRTSTGRPCIHWVATRPDHRHNRIATNLVTRVIEHFRCNGESEVFVSTNPTTEENVAFYKSLGFHEWESLQV